MIEHPVIFDDAMVRAILDGRKTQTRRVVRPEVKVCPYGGQGDCLWVKEAYILENNYEIGVSEPPFYDRPIKWYGAGDWQWWEQPHYRATDPDPQLDCPEIIWRPAQFMPRWASRITLVIRDVRTERLQSISNADVLAEGVMSKDEFARAWDAEHSNALWITNPLVWVITFEPEKTTGGAAWNRLTDEVKSSVMREMGKRGGRKGGLARARNLSPEQMSAAMRRAAHARWRRHREAKEAMEQ
jgi:hypothetical protein